MSEFLKCSCGKVGLASPGAIPSGATHRLHAEFNGTTHRFPEPCYVTSSALPVLPEPQVFTLSDDDLFPVNSKGVPVLDPEETP